MRTLRFERLERRDLMSVCSPMDVNNDHYITPADVLNVINTLNGNQSPNVMSDVNQDGKTTPIDALIVINWINFNGITRAPMSCMAFGDVVIDTSPIRRWTPAKTTSLAEISWSKDVDTFNRAFIFIEFIGDPPLNLQVKGVNGDIGAKVHYDHEHGWAFMSEFTANSKAGTSWILYGDANPGKIRVYLVDAMLLEPVSIGAWRVVE
jgi:hypothetical protein